MNIRISFRSKTIVYICSIKFLSLLFFVIIYVSTENRSQEFFSSGQIKFNVFEIVTLGTILRNQFVFQNRSKCKNLRFNRNIRVDKWLDVYRVRINGIKGWEEILNLRFFFLNESSLQQAINMKRTYGNGRPQ